MGVKEMKELRETAGLTQAQMAERMGLGKTAYVDLETDDPDWKKFKDRHQLALERASLALAIERGDIRLALPTVRREALQLAQLIVGQESGPKMRTPSIRQSMFPYGMAMNSDGTWTLFNRHYKAVGLRTDDWSDWDTAQHKMRLKGLGPATRAKLDWHGVGDGDRIYFYADACNPSNSKADMDRYLEKLRILMSLEVERL